MTDFARGVTIPLEIAHHSVNGALHGHTLLIEVWTRADADLDTLKDTLTARLAFMENGTLEQHVGRTFEDVARRVLAEIPAADRVVVRLPSRGHAVEAIR